MHFAQPVWLVVGALAAGTLVFISLRREAARREALGRFAAHGLLDRLTASVSPGRRRIKLTLLAVALFSLFAALARPQVGYRWEEVRRRGIDILMAIDTSKSMLAADVAPDRLTRAKLGIRDFVEQLEGDRVGLLPFAGRAFLFCPLTLDYDAFGESLAAVDEDLVPEGGTDLAEAIREARAALEADANHRILVLITDGEDLEGEALAEAKRAGAEGITIHTVGVGTPAGELIAYRDSDGRRQMVHDEGGELVTSRLDEDMLRQVAAATGGAYEPLGRGAEGLQRIYERKLSLVPKEEFSQRRRKVPLDRFEWPLALAALLLLQEFLLGDRRLRPERRAEVTTAARRPAKGAAAAAAVLAALFLLAAPAHADDGRLAYNRGTEAYREGDYEAAASSFRTAIRSPDLALQNRSYYNLGNVLYRQGQQTEQDDAAATIERWKEALSHYEGARALDADDADAAFNHAHVERRLEELERKQQDQKQEQQQDQQDQQEEQDQQQRECSQPQDQENSGDESEGEPQDREESTDEAQGRPGDSQESGAESQERPRERSEDEDRPGSERPEEESDEGDEEAPPARPGRMTRAEAEGLLDSLAEEQGMLRFVPHRRGDGKRDEERRRRDW